MCRLPYGELPLRTRMNARFDFLYISCSNRSTLRVEISSHYARYKSSIKDLGVIMDTKLTFKHHVTYIIDKASRALGFIFRIARDFSDIYCLKALYCSLVRSTLEYCAVVWSPCYLNGVTRIESVQRKFIRFALRRLPWQNPQSLPSYESRCQLIDLDLLNIRRDVSRSLFVADLLSAHIDCPPLLQRIGLSIPPRLLRNYASVHVPFSRTNYGAHGAINGLLRCFNRCSDSFDFDLPRQAIKRNCFNVFRRR